MGQFLKDSCGQLYSDTSPYGEFSLHWAIKTFPLWPCIWIYYSCQKMYTNRIIIILV